MTKTLRHVSLPLGQGREATARGAAAQAKLHLGSDRPRGGFVVEPSRVISFWAVMPEYECDKCGACCTGNLLVEAYDLDVLREPRLADADIGQWTRGMTLQTLMAELEQEGKCLLLAGGVHTCTFLRDDNTCGIYPTRPNVCVGMQAGGDQCQQARGMEGLPPLAPVDLQAEVPVRRDGVAGSVRPGWRPAA